MSPEKLFARDTHVVASQRGRIDRKLRAFGSERSITPAAEKGSETTYTAFHPDSCSMTNPQHLHRCNTGTESTSLSPKSPFSSRITSNLSRNPNPNHRNQLLSPLSAQTRLEAHLQSLSFNSRPLASTTPQSTKRTSLPRAEER